MSGGSALTPDAVTRLTGQGIEVLVHAGAGAGASLPDAAYVDAGARIVADEAELLAQADALVTVGRPEDDWIEGLRRGAVLVGLFQPLSSRDLVDRLAGAGLTAFSLDAIPRITRAQSMDALSSQATVSGYKAVLIAADTSPLLPDADDRRRHHHARQGAGARRRRRRAAGDRHGPPAGRRRLGVRRRGRWSRSRCRAWARRSSSSSSRSRSAEDAGGYANELSEDAARARSRSSSQRRSPSADVVITTALIPGRPAPQLITDDAVGRMRPGLGDRRPGGRGRRQLRADEPGEVIVRNGVTIVGHAQPALHDAAARQPDVRAATSQAAARPDHRTARLRSTSTTRSSRDALHHARRQDRLRRAGSLGSGRSERMTARPSSPSSCWRRSSASR